MDRGEVHKRASMLFCQQVQLARIGGSVSTVPVKLDHGGRL
jgi:hypothetical protein